MTSRDIHPTDLQDVLNDALAEHHSGGYEAAVDRYQMILEHHPERADVWGYLGVALRGAGDIQGAVKAGQESVRLAPASAEAWNGLAGSQRRAGDDEAARFSLRRAIEINPRYAEAWANLADLARDRGARDEAYQGYCRAAELTRDIAPFQNDVGNRLFDLGAFEAAAACYDAAVNAAPSMVQAWNNLGNTRRCLHDFGGAVAAYDRALAIEPGLGPAANGRAQTLLLTGDFERGWPAYETRFSAPGAPPKPRYSQPEWQGEDIRDQRILVYGEQGLGDTLQFVRFCRPLAERGAAVILLCQRRAAALARTACGIDRVVAMGEALPDFDRHIPLMSLPRVLGTGDDTLAHAVPYLSAPPDRDRPKSTARNRIGLSWSGNPDHVDDKRRSLSLQKLAPLLDRPDVEFVSLQLDGAAEIERLGLGGRLTDGAAGDRDLADTAATLMSLDLVITVDTAIAHLAGALARPCWVMLPHLPDWRWLLERDDSPWYPSLTLFRQPRPDDWHSVVRRVADALDQQIKEEP